MNTPYNQPDIAAHHVFHCAKCGQAAGEVTVCKNGELVRKSFVSELKMGTKREGFEGLCEAVRQGDIKVLYKYDFEIASFYCPECDVCYCRDHWSCINAFSNDDGFTWHEGIEGTCPEGHTRLLED